MKESEHKKGRQQATEEMEENVENTSHGNPAPPAETKSEGADPSSDLKQKLAEAQQELLYQRAEFENFKKRMHREQEKAVLFSNERLIGELLTIVDQLERAIAHGESLKKEEGAASFLEGVKMTHQQFVSLLGRFGVEFVGTVGEAFDPTRHEAISEQASGGKPNTILAVHQKGCLLHGRLLKPAKVVVVKA